LGEIRNAHEILGERSRRRLEDNIRMDLREIGWDWMHLAREREQWWVLLNAIMNLRAP
jgi:hypothetical protein